MSTFDRRVILPRSEVISSTMSGVLQEYFKSSERTVFWNEELKMNVDPFQDMEGDFFNAPWDLKVCIYSIRVIPISQADTLHACSSSEFCGNSLNCSSVIVPKSRIS